MDAEKAVAVIDDAIALLEKDGWCQDTTENDEGQRCLVGAICTDATYRSFNWREAIVPALRAVAVVTTGMPCGIISFWNDEPGRSIEDVFLALKQAKDILFAEGTGA